MTDTTKLTLSLLWKRATAEQRMAVAHAFWRDDQATDTHGQAVLLIAQQKKFRPKTVRSLDEEKKARHLATLPNLPDAIVARALVAYHLAEQRPMMGAFLDALGIAHEEGVIGDSSVAPDPAKLEAAVARLAELYPAADLWLYLNTLLCQDPETWGGLADVLAKLGLR